MNNRSKHRVEVTIASGMKVRCLNQHDLAGNIFLTDVSINGMSLVSGHPLEKLLDAEIQLPDKYATKENAASRLSVKAELMWLKFNEADNTYTHGFRFVSLDKSAESTLSKLVEYELEENKRTQKLLIPKERHDNYTRSVIKKRLQWLSHKTNTSFTHIPRFSIDPATCKGNIEGMIGAVQIPIGIAGPLKVNGQYAQGEFYVPLATTEGALVMTYDLGMRMITKAGGATTKVIRDETNISPVFFIGEMKKADEFIEWVQNNYETIKQKAESVTNHGKLIKIEPITINTKTLLKFVFTTGDAHGLNMINKAVKQACDHISRETGYKYIQRANYSGIKKLNMDNIYNGLGKSAVAEVIISRDLLRILRVIPEEIVELYNIGILSSTYAGMVGINAHVANGITGIFVACGQDIADISVSTTGFISYEVMDTGNLYVRLCLPNLLVATVGGGTGIGTQKECLEIMDCYGHGKVKKLAEIIAASALAGEIAVMCALVNGSYVEAHEKYGRNNPAQKLN